MFNDLPITGERIVGSRLFPRVSVLYDVQIISFRIWTQVANLDVNVNDDFL